MNPQKILLFGCLLCFSVSIPYSTAQGTVKVQEFFKKYFGEYFPKTTRGYTLYGNGLNGPADFNAGLPIEENHEGPVNSIIVRRGSPGRNQQDHQGFAQPQESAWQPVQNFDPVAFVKGGHRGRSDLTDELDDAESRIITAEDVLEANGGNDNREFRMESSMSFAPGKVL